jgi:apolipoprotein N-acyltransferase
MHTLFVILQGFLLLLIFLLVAKLATPEASGRRPRHRYLACRAFIFVWLIVAAINLWIGVDHGHTVVEEIPFFLLVFGLPAASAALIGQRSLRQIDA